MSPTRLCLTRDQLDEAREGATTPSTPATQAAVYHDAVRRILTVCDLCATPDAVVTLVRRIAQEALAAEGLSDG